MICQRLDRELRVFAQKHGCLYTRYADDLTFSTRRQSFPAALAEVEPDEAVHLGAPLADIIQANGFNAQASKTRLQHRSQRQLVTGVIVNERLNVDRRYIRRIRAMLHNWQVHGLGIVQRDFDEKYDLKDRHPNSAPTFVSVLRGRIAYLAMIRGPSDTIARRFADQFENLLRGRDLNYGIDYIIPAPQGLGSRALERRRLLTVMFTDIVDSTARAAIMGDRKWHDVLEAHNRRVRSQLGRHGGTEIKTLGDGFLATFESPTAAILCALAIQDAVSPLAIDVKIGLHTSEVSPVGDDIEGMGVDIASRVGGLAHSGEVLVSSTVKDLVTGGDFAFADRGAQPLKGAGTWHIYRALRGDS